MKKSLILLSFAVLLQAQMRMEMPPEMGRGNREIENYRIMRMTEYMELSPEQADKFFPRLREHRNQVRNLHLKMRNLGDEIGTENGMIPKDLSKGDLDKLMQNLGLLEDEEANLREGFHSEMEEYLNPYQIGRFMYFEQTFRKELQQTMKEKWKKMKNRR